MSGKNILLGLGIGMVCSGMLLGLFNRKGFEISDAEIKKRAAELGMVEDNRDVILTSELKDKDKDKDTDIDNEDNSDFQKEEISNKEEGDSQNQELLENNEKDINTEKEANTVKTQITQPEKQEEQIKKKEKTNSSSAKKDSNIAKKESNKNKSSTKQENSITIEIATGMTAGEICEELKEQGIIKNAVKFRNYISKKEMQRNLRAGTYHISKNAKYDEILEIICKG